jgi:small conductance mechanosensitive channel
LRLSLRPILVGQGITGFVLGFALQEVLGDFAAGMMILVYIPFDVGAMIEAAGVFAVAQSDRRER